jgi:hypothetical protein
VGVDETAIQETPVGADVGFGTFYSYFSSKDKIATRVLDCVIPTLGQRCDLSMRDAGIVDPVLVVSNSVRALSATRRSHVALVARAQTSWSGGFRPFGIRDM